MSSFKKREIIFRPYEPVIRTIVNIAVIICAAYLMVDLFFNNLTITGHSMNDTLEDGNTVLVNEAAFDFSPPDRYDLIVFEPQISNVSQYYVKRVIGLPGETVQIIEGKVYIDGKALTDDVIDVYIYNQGAASEEILLGEDEYFVLGDNRNNSDDSRFSTVGLVKEDSIIGKPWFIIRPFSDFGIIDAVAPETESETSTE